MSKIRIVWLLCIHFVIQSTAQRVIADVVADAQREEPIVKRLPTWYYYDAQHRMSFCAIPKNMSTMMRSLFCDLLKLTQNNGTAVQYRTSLGPEVPVFTCDNVPSFSNHFEVSTGPYWKSENEELAQVRKQSRKVGKEVNFVITRDPIERFISAYGHLCLRNNQCGKPGKSVLATVQALYTLQRTGSYGADLRPELVFQLEGHFAPQIWSCHCGDKVARDRVKLLRYSRNQEDNIAMVDELFEEVGVNKTVRDMVLTRMRDQRTFHAGNVWRTNKIINEMRNKPIILAWLVRLYYWDFVQLGYPIPKSVKDIWFNK